MFALLAAFAGYEALLFCTYIATIEMHKATYMREVMNLKLERCRHGVGLLVDLALFCAMGHSVQEHNTDVLFISILWSRGQSSP